MPQGIISIDGLRFTYPGGSTPSLANVQLHVEQGDFVAIIGSNGSGKTTLCKALNGVIPHYLDGDFAGDVRVNGIDTLSSSVAELSQHIAYVYQDFETQLVRATVREDVEFAPLNFGLEDYRERAQRALQILGLEPLADKFIWQLSGGEKHLVALAGALPLKPAILIVDEPSAQLDPYRAALIYDKLKELNEQHGKTILVIEHHCEFIADYCKSVVLMDRGSVAWHMPVREALNRTGELAQRCIYPPQVTQAVEQLEKHGGRQKSGLYPVQIAQCVDEFQGAPIRLVGADERELPPEEKTPVLQLQGATFCVGNQGDDAPRPVDGVTLTVHEGDRLAVVGNNGAGKTTLLKLISGIIKPTEGDVIVCGRNTRATSPGELCEAVSYVFQNPEEMFIEDCVRRDVEFALRARKHPQMKQIVDQVLQGLKLEELEQRDGRLLSGGQQRRVSLAIGVATRPAIILLDEPTGSLDIASRTEMIELLDGLSGWIKTVIIATHDMQLVAEWSNRVVVMNGGKILRDGDMRHVFSDDSLLRRANLRAPQIVEFCKQLNIDPPAYSLREWTQRLRAQEGGKTRGENGQAAG